MSLNSVDGGLYEGVPDGVNRLYMGQDVDIWPTVELRKYRLAEITPDLTIAYLLMESSKKYHEKNTQMESMSELQNQKVIFTTPTNNRAPWAVLGGQVVATTINSYKAGETSYVDIQQLEPHYVDAVANYFFDTHGISKEQIVGLNFMVLNNESS